MKCLEYNQHGSCGSLTLGVGDINLCPCITGLYYVSGEVMSSGRASHLCQALTKHTVSSSSQWPRVDHLWKQEVWPKRSSSCWRLGWRKAPLGPVSPRFAGGTLEVREEALQVEAGPQLHRPQPGRGMAAQQVGLSLARVRRSGAKVNLLVKVTNARDHLSTAFGAEEPATSHPGNSTPVSRARASGREGRPQATWAGNGSTLHAVQRPCPGRLPVASLSSSVIGWD